MKTYVNLPAAFDAARKLSLQVDDEVCVRPARDKSGNFEVYACEDPESFCSEEDWADPDFDECDQCAMFYAGIFDRGNRAYSPSEEVKRIANRPKNLKLDDKHFEELYGTTRAACLVRSAA